MNGKSGLHELNSTERLRETTLEYKRSFKEVLFSSITVQVGGPYAGDADMKSLDKKCLQEKLRRGC